MIVILSLESGFNVLISRQLYIKEEMVVIGSFSSMLPNFQSLHLSITIIASNTMV